MQGPIAIAQATAICQSNQLNNQYVGQSLRTAPSSQRPQSSARRRANQYDANLHTWEPAFLHDVPFPAGEWSTGMHGGVAVNAVNAQSTQAPASENSFDAYYRYMCVEMETGANNRHDVLAKIDRYNRAFRRAEIRQYMYGDRPPRVLIVARHKAQLGRMIQLWHSHFANRVETVLLVTSLQTLAEAYIRGGGRQGLIELPCWIDVFRRDGPQWCTLDKAICIDLMVAQAEEARRREG